MKSRLYSSFLFSAAAAVAIVATAHADENTQTIKFSDPSKPGLLRVSLGRGELRIQGADTNEITVKSDARPSNVKRKDGMRVLTAASSYSLSEADNVVRLESAMQDWGKRNSEFRITVPRNTSVVVENAWGGDFQCSGISGDVEINSMQGEIRLDDLSGGILVSTMNGEIRASMTELREGKTFSFTSMNGEITVRLPETAKANVRMRTQHGEVLTDFDETVLVTKSEASTPMSRGRSAWTIKGPGGKVLATEIEEAIREASRVSATAVREALEAVKQGLEASRLGAEEAKRELESARREIDAARREADKERAELARREADREREAARREAEREREQRRVATARAGTNVNVDANVNVNAPKPAPAPAAPGAMPAMPKPAKVPTISGGNLVTGTLNGGGPEISIATMNGNVVLRKLEKK